MGESERCQRCKLTFSGEREVKMEKEFSEGFMNDIADLLKLCIENNTDNIGLNFNINGRKLNMDIIFSIIILDD